MVRPTQGGDTGLAWLAGTEDSALWLHRGTGSLEIRTPCLDIVTLSSWCCLLSLLFPIVPVARVGLGPRPVRGCCPPPPSHHFPPPAPSCPCRFQSPLSLLRPTKESRVSRPSALRLLSLTFLLQPSRTLVSHHPIRYTPVLQPPLPLSVIFQLSQLSPHPTLPSSIYQYQIIQTRFIHQSRLTSP